MAAAKKLQGDIEALNKKVDLGIQEFDGLMENHKHASQPHQREKYEEQMKASIKKLQRERAQLSTYLNDKSVKEKGPIEANKQKIEVRMERHKTFERDVKKGIVGEEREDPDQEKRAECRSWMTDQVNQLLQEIDEFTAVIEQLQVKKGSKNAKDESHAGFNKRMQECHRWHVNKLEQLLRKLDNQDVDLDALECVKAGLESYLDPEMNLRTPEVFSSYDDVYDDFHLEQVQDYLAQRAASHSHSEEKEEKEEPKKEEAKPQAPPKASAKPAPTVSVHPVHKPAVEEKSEDPSSSLPPAKVAPPKQIATKPAAVALATPAVPSQPVPAQPQAQPQNQPPPPQAQVQPQVQLQVQPQAQKAPQQGPPPTVPPQPAAAPAQPPPKQPPQLAQPAPEPTPQPTQPPAPAAQASFAPPILPPSLPPTTTAVPDPREPPSVPPPPPDKPPAASQTGRALPRPTEAPPSPPQDPGPVPPAHAPAPVPRARAAVPQAEAPAGLVDAGPVTGAVSYDVPPLTKSQEKAHALLESSARHMPQPSDVRRNRKYQPQAPYTHKDAMNQPLYCTETVRTFEDPALPGLFERFEQDTLFWAFYHQQGTYQQYLAAKELKKLSWRYHTKYLTWFQRHEEPRLTAADFERGTYVFFDFDGQWSQRIKADFTFEYAWLESGEI